MLSNLLNKNIILASKSPRRHELLKGLDLEFEIRTKDVEEIYPSDLAPTDVPDFLAKLKAREFENELKDDDILITSDTIVVLADEILEKPKSEKEAITMLHKMSNCEHIVVTAVCIKSLTKTIVFSDHTKVTFSQLSDEEIKYYINKYKPFDKAGSYGVQEWIGYIAIEKLEGSYYNVMGLPVHKLYQNLKKF